MGSVPRRNTAQRRKPAKLIWDTQHLLEPAMNPGAENIHGAPTSSRCVVAVPVSPFLSSPGGAWAAHIDRGTTVPPAVLVDLDLKAFWQARHFTFASSVAGQAGCAGAATGAGARAVPGAVRVGLAQTQPKSSQLTHVVVVAPTDTGFSSLGIRRPRAGAAPAVRRSALWRWRR